MPYSAKELDKIYSLKKQGDPVSFLIRVSNSSDPPRGIPNCIDFRDREFKELMQRATTPKFSLDRGVKLNER